MKVTVLDLGYVEFIEAWGTGKAGGVERLQREDAVDYEVGIVEAARQSTQGSFKGWDEDMGLMRTLFNHQANQSTPFEAAGMTIEVCAPIMVFREWHRHRTQSYNEASARYKPLEADYYRPNLLNLLERSVVTTRNKQAQTVTSARKLTDKDAEDWLTCLDDLYAYAEKFYQLGLKMGVPKELARVGMPVGHFSTMRATANLRNWLGFLTLRLDEKAQWEIRQYAHAVNELIRQYFPHTHQLFWEAQNGA